MAIIADGNTPTQLMGVDANSRAGRVSPYGPDGQALVYNSNNDRGVADIRVKASSTAAASTVVWGLLNKSSGKTLYIYRICLQPGFNGTGAASEQQWELVKGTGCTALTNSTVVTPLISRTGIANSDVLAGVLDTGITLTGVTLGSPFYNIYWARLTHSATQAGNMGDQHILDFSSTPLELAYQEVLAIRNAQTQVIGDLLSGGCFFYGG